MSPGLEPSAKIRIASALPRSNPAASSADATRAPDGPAAVWGLDPDLPWVVLLALWGNIVVSGFAGAFIPTVLDRVGVDPAVASSVFLTALTDLCGFMLLLGLASFLLL